MKSRSKVCDIDADISVNCSYKNSKLKSDFPVMLVVGWAGAAALSSACSQQSHHWKQEISLLIPQEAQAAGQLLFQMKLHIFWDTPCTQVSLRLWLCTGVRRVSAAERSGRCTSPITPLYSFSQGQKATAAHLLLCYVITLMKLTSGTNSSSSTQTHTA